MVQPSKEVVIVTAHWPPRLGGHADYSRRLAEAMAHQGYRVEVIVLGQPEAEQLPVTANVTVAPFPGGFRSLVDATMAIRRSRARIVLLQFEAHAFRLKALPHALPLLLRSLGLRVIMTYHELWKPRRLGWTSKALLLNSPHHVVVFSDWHRDGVRKFRRFGAVSVIPVGSNIAVSTIGQKALLRTRFGIPADVTVITFFGFLIPEHCVMEAVEAIAQLHDDGKKVLLSVIGDFDAARNAYHQQLQQRVRELELHQQVVWHGRSEESAIERLLSVSDLGLIPYRAGVGENNGAFAAMANFSLPIVTTSGARSRQMEMEGIALFAVPDAGGLARALGTLLGDPTLRRETAARGAAWARRREWTRLGTAYHNLVQEADATGEPA